MSDVLITDDRAPYSKIIVDGTPFFKSDYSIVLFVTQCIPTVSSIVYSFAVVGFSPISRRIALPLAIIFFKSMFYIWVTYYY